jgi:hypothetical protein
VIALENKVNRPAAGSQVAAAQPGDLCAAAGNCAGIGTFNRADHMQHRGLARAGRAGERDKRSGRDSQIDVLGRPHLGVLANAVALADGAQLDRGTSEFGHGCSSADGCGDTAEFAWHRS